MNINVSLQWLWAKKPFYAMALLVMVAGLWAYRTQLRIWVCAPGIIRAEGAAIAIVSETGGKVRDVYATEDMEVRPGDPLVQFDTRKLALKKQALESRIHFTELRLSAVKDRLERTELTNLYKQLHDLRKEIGNLTITSPADGQITILAPLHPGEVLSPGTAIGALIPYSRAPGNNIPDPSSASNRR